MEFHTLRIRSCIRKKEEWPCAYAGMHWKQGINQPRVTGWPSVSYYYYSSTPLENGSTSGWRNTPETSSPRPAPVMNSVFAFISSRIWDDSSSQHWQLRSSKHSTISSRQQRMPSPNSWVICILTESPPCGNMTPCGCLWKTLYEYSVVRIGAKSMSCVASSQVTLQQNCSSTQNYGQHPPMRRLPTPVWSFVHWICKQGESARPLLSECQTKYPVSPLFHSWRSHASPKSLILYLRL